MKATICHIITKLELGGAQKNTLFTVSHLDKSKFDVILIAGKGGILDKEAADIQVVFDSNLVREISPFKDLLAIFSIYRTLKKFKPAVVHTHSSKAGIVGRIAAYLAEIPVIIHTYHGFGFHDFQNKLKKKVYVFIEQAVAPITSKLIAVSKDNITKGIENHIGVESQYMVIRSGIDLAKYKNLTVSKSNKLAELGINQNKKIITTIGPFKPQKNIKDLVTTASILREKNDNFVLLIIGDGSERPQIEAQISKFGLGANIKLMGWRNDTAEILAVSDIFAMSSLWEGLPRACLEAMALGIPPVVNAVDGLKELITDTNNGFLIQPFKTDDMALAILTLMENEILAKKIGQSAKASITNEFDINYMVKQQENLYTELLK